MTDHASEDDTSRLLYCSIDIFRALKISCHQLNFEETWQVHERQKQT